MTQTMVLTIYDPKLVLDKWKIFSFGFLILESGVFLHYFCDYSVRRVLSILLFNAYLVFYILIILDSVSKLLRKVDEQYMKYKNLVDFIYGVFITMDEDLTINFVNQRLLNFSEQDLQGKNLKNFPFYDKEIIKKLKKEKERQTYNWKYVNQYNEVFWFVIDATINNEEIALLIRDVSSKKKIEEQETINLQNIAALKAKNEFIASVSHEIRNPLQVISYNIENLLSKDLTKEITETLEDVYSSTKFLTTIIGDILDYSKIEAGEMKVAKTNFDLLEIVENSISMNSKSCLEKGLKMNLDFDFSLPKYFFGDSSRTLQIINNLVSNAIKYTKQGSIQISARRIKLSGNDKLYVECSDSGIGISKENLTNLFDPFIQVSQNKYSPTQFKGWGLGLSICKKLLNLMNGEFGVKSELGKGSIFWFSLPMKNFEIENSSYDQIFVNPIVDEVNIIHTDDNISNQIKKILLDVKFPKIEINSMNFNKNQIIFVEKNLWNLIPNDIMKKKIVVIDTNPVGDFNFLKYPILPSNLLNFVIQMNKKEEIPKKFQVHNHLKILIVDDNPLILKSLERLLQTIQITDIQKAKDGKEAFDIVNETDEIFDVIFMDISMPVMNGIVSTELIRNLKNEKKSKTLIFALTGNVLVKSIEEQKEEWKMDEIITKPVNKNELLTVLQKLKKI